MSPPRRLFLALGLALALLFGQHAAALHGLKHAAERLAQDEGSTLPEKCEEHSLFASLGSALGAEAPSVALAVAVAPAAGAPELPAASLPTRYSFRSRAPPTAPA